ncbi:MAG: 16S rRNA (cytosine(967)-C(5))-methyltransferase, partial [Clostridia bacterium]|nr:16S rRNA (cytosine(967)-C(5))-methyltransferase [Clostridia bacterium]
MAHSRQVALDILIAWEREGSYPNLLLKEKLNCLSDRRERALCTQIVYGTIENKLKLDHYISGVSSVPLKKIHIVNRNILRMGLYQGLFLDIPISAACNTSVDLAKKNGQFKSSGFVNAVLRKLLSNSEQLELPSENDVTSLSVRYSVDPSIVSL